MKELTIQEKAKAYDKAFRIAQELYNDPNSSNVGKGYVCTVFPKLKESEDESIRKEIISALKYANHKGVYDKHIAWLEKQCKQKPNPVLDIEIPFGAKDSELQEATYYVPKGFHAEIERDKVIIKKLAK